RGTQKERLSGLFQALQEGASLLDLYFLNHFGIPWYAEAAGLDVPNICEPHAFVASLEIAHLNRIAIALRHCLTAWYGGKLVGRRPRFLAFATFFPDISFVS